MSNHIGGIQRVVVCAANRYKDTTGYWNHVPIIVLGARHFDNRMQEQIRALSLAGYILSPARWEQGFVDQYGVFMNRHEALEVATKAGQINTRRTKTTPYDRLFSEDLY